MACRQSGLSRPSSRDSRVPFLGSVLRRLFDTFLSDARGRWIRSPVTQPFSGVAPN
jgi:hypothetical protein